MADSPGIEADGVSELLVDLENAAQIPTKQRAIKISGLVNTLCSRMYEDGLSNLALGKLVDIITLPHHLDQASVGSLIKNLYPASKVQDAIIIKVVGSLGHGSAKPSFAAQTLFLKWLVMVYEVIENPRILSQLYGILFNLLDTIAIRPQLCHVLALITRRKHVRTFRIRALMEITRHAGNDPPLVGLMRVYKDFYPDFIVGDATHGRASVFTHPNIEWRQRLGEIQEQYFQRTQDGLRPEQRSFRITRRAINGWKRRKLSVLPDLHTSHAQESSITLEEIENVADFIQNLEKIELPNQLVAVIGDPLLQKLLQLKSSSTISLRVDSWLLAFFEDKLQSSSIEAEKGILEMLAAVRDYTRHTKKVPDACLKYLNSMMESWNGVTGREVILDILTYTPITPFEELQQSLFQTLEDAILDGTAESMLALLNFYTKLLQQWIAILLAESHLSGIDGLAISSLVIYINNLALSLLQTSPNVATYSTILYFYEPVAFLISHPDLTALRCITIPQEIFIYTLNFTFSLNVVSRLCGILALYKRGFELAMSSDEQPYPKDYVNRFNGFLMDVCNCLWRGRAFNTSDVNALGCLLPQNSESSLSKYVSDINPHLALPSLFSLSYSPVLCLLAISYFREEEDAKDDEIDIRHAGPVTQRSLVQLGKNGGLAMPWPDYRLGVLQYLEKKSVAGVGELMYNTMKHLMKNSKV